MPSWWVTSRIWLFLIVHRLRRSCCVEIVERDSLDAAVPFFHPYTHISLHWICRRLIFSEHFYWSRRFSDINVNFTLLINACISWQFPCYNFCRDIFRSRLQWTSRYRLRLNIYGEPKLVGLYFLCARCDTKSSDGCSCSCHSRVYFYSLFRGVVFDVPWRNECPFKRRVVRSFITLTPTLPFRRW